MAGEAVLDKLLRELSAWKGEIERDRSEHVLLKQELDVSWRTWLSHSTTTSLFYYLSVVYICTLNVLHLPRQKSRS